jgi:two-component system, response regulator / RNA-binding antiterminator
VKPVVDVAIARFKQFQKLYSELDKTKATLAGRKLVERANCTNWQRARSTMSVLMAAIHEINLDIRPLGDMTQYVVIDL